MTEDVPDKYDILLRELKEDNRNYHHIYGIILQDLNDKNIDRERIYDVLQQVLDVPKPVVIKHTPPIPPPTIYNIVYLFQYNPHKYSNVYKIGMTTRTVDKRLKDYSRDTRRIHHAQLQYIPCRTMETIILYVFRKSQSFKSRNDLGTEYFEGNGGIILFKFKELIELCDIPDLKDYTPIFAAHPIDVQKFSNNNINLDDIINTI